MKRLESTRDIFRNSLQTTINLLDKTDAQITLDFRELNALRGSIMRTKRQSTLDKQLLQLQILAERLGHSAPRTASKTKMINCIKWCKRKNAFLRYAAINQALINLCVIYEDFIRRIFLKYYEEDIRRLKSNKETMKNDILVDMLLRGDNLHRSMAEKVVDDLMYGSVDKWFNSLRNIGMSIVDSPQLQELFLVRNCFVHNNRRVSSVLADQNAANYKLRQPIVLTVDDIKNQKDIVHKSATFIMSEYGRLFPTQKGGWVR